MKKASIQLSGLFINIPKDGQALTLLMEYIAIYPKLHIERVINDKEGDRFKVRINSVRRSFPDKNDFVNANRDVYKNALEYINDNLPNS